VLFDITSMSVIRHVITAQPGYGIPMLINGCVYMSLAWPESLDRLMHP